MNGGWRCEEQNTHPQEQISVCMLLGFIVHPDPRTCASQYKQRGMVQTSFTIFMRWAGGDASKLSLMGRCLIKILNLPLLMKFVVWKKKGMKQHKFKIIKLKNMTFMLKIDCCLWYHLRLIYETKCKKQSFSVPVTLNLGGVQSLPIADKHCYKE